MRCCEYWFGDHSVLSGFVRATIGYLPAHDHALPVGDAKNGLNHVQDEVFVLFIFNPDGEQLDAVGRRIKQQSCQTLGNDGHVEVESEPGQGACFRIYLPRHDVGPQPAEPDRDVTPGSTAHHTVLLVEDEPAMRALMQRVLRSLGYLVLTASEGREALAVAAAHPGTIHLLLTDLVMPEMGGLELAEALVALRPETRVLVCSGYAGDPDLGSRRHALLPKPYSPGLLAQRVRETLDAVR